CTLHTFPTRRSSDLDLAVVRINTRGKLPPPVAIGSSGDLKVGQYALAIGNPFGLDQSLTTGVISALKRRMPTSAGREISNVIQRSEEHTSELQSREN